MLRHPALLASALDAVLLGASVLLWPGAVAAEEKAPGTLQQSDVFVSGREGYQTYRIPAILVTKSGTVLAFCEGRKYSSSDTGDIDMLLRRSTDGGRTFSGQQIIWDDDANTCGNPCPVVERETGTIFLLMTHNLGRDQESQIVARKSRGTRTVWVSKSGDDGRTWSQPVDITSQAKRPDWTWYATGPGAGIQLASGRLVIPCDHIEAETRLFNSHVLYSDDRGATWKLGGTCGPHTNECEVIQRADGSLLLNMRNYNRKHQCRAVGVSTDEGLTWSKPEYDPALVEPVCQASIRRHSLATAGGKNRLLFSNPAQTNKRTTMTVRLSYDEGKTWPVGKVLHAGPAAYSCLAVLSDGTILCLYERGQKHAYQQITLARFTRGWLTDGRDGK